MPKTALRFLLAAALSLGVVAPLSAQGLTPGTWTGSIANPAGGVASVTFDVSGTAEAPTVHMRFAMLPEPMPFNDLRLDGPTMTFWWEPGIRVDCTLTRDEAGGYAGPCSDGSGSGDGRLTMVPPNGTPR